jgi:REP element-mobilizing transposase RayT
MPQRSQPQLELDLRIGTWGGARKNAGKKKRCDRREPAHRARGRVRHYNPRHIVLRVRAEMPRLRHPAAFEAVRDVLLRFLDDDSFRICHISIQANHLHLIVEAENRAAFVRGMNRLTTALARAINRKLHRLGTVFAFRYYDVEIDSPLQARRALLYVINNWRHHREDERHPAAIDPYSSGYAFDGWTARPEQPSFMTLPVSPPRTWLLRTGWRRHGLIDVGEVPGDNAD